MLSSKYFTTKYWSQKYHWFGGLVVTGVNYAGAYAIIVGFRPSKPTAVFDALRGVTVELDKTAIAEDADQAIIERIGRSAVISGGMTNSTIERVK